MAIVGPTGAGKTTLVNLIMRFYELDAGRITLDGVDIAAMPRAELRSQIGMVLQDTWLFHGTIWENIAYGRPDASEAEIRAAAEATYVDRFVHTLPDGYETVIDEEGSNVSAGEKQLITIARAFLADPALLILDEATSSVDTRTEVLVQRAMAALRSDRTSFVIAHRLSTIRDADVILVMEGGRIVEQGSHARAARGPRRLLRALQRAVQCRGRGARQPSEPAARGRGRRSHRLADQRDHAIRIVLDHPPGEPEHSPSMQHQQVLPGAIGLEHLRVGVELPAVDLDDQSESAEEDVDVNRRSATITGWFPFQPVMPASRNNR